MSNNCPPQLSLSLPVNTPSFKRTFQEYGYDLESPDGDAAASSAHDGNDRNKRPRSTSSFSDEDSVGTSHSSGLSTESSLASVSETEPESESMPVSGTTRPPVLATHTSQDPPPRLPTPVIQDIEMESYTEAMADEPERFPVLRSLSPTTQPTESYRIALQRFSEFDSELSTLRRPLTPPPTLPPLVLNEDPNTFEGLDGSNEQSAQASTSELEPPVAPRIPLATPLTLSSDWHGLSGPLPSTSLSREYNSIREHLNSALDGVLPPTPLVPELIRGGHEDEAASSSRSSPPSLPPIIPHDDLPWMEENFVDGLPNFHQWLLQSDEEDEPPLPSRITRRSTRLRGVPDTSASSSSVQPDERLANRAWNTAPQSRSQFQSTFGVIRERSIRERAVQREIEAEREREAQRQRDAQREREAQRHRERERERQRMRETARMQLYLRESDRQHNALFGVRQDPSTSLGESPTTEREANLSHWAFGAVDRRGSFSDISESEGDDDMSVFSRYPTRLGLGARRQPSSTNPQSSNDLLQELIVSMSDDSLWSSLSDVSPSLFSPAARPTNASTTSNPSSTSTDDPASTTRNPFILPAYRPRPRFQGMHPRPSASNSLMAENASERRRREGRAEVMRDMNQNSLDLGDQDHGGLSDALSGFYHGESNPVENRTSEDLNARFGARQRGRPNMLPQVLQGRSGVRAVLQPSQTRRRDPVLPELDSSFSSFESFEDFGRNSPPLEPPSSLSRMFFQPIPTRDRANEAHTIRNESFNQSLDHGPPHVRLNTHINRRPERVDRGFFDSRASTISDMVNTIASTTEPRRNSGDSVNSDSRNSNIRPTAPSLPNPDLGSMFPGALGDLNDLEDLLRPPPRPAPTTHHNHWAEGSQTSNIPLPSRAEHDTLTLSNPTNWYAVHRTRRWREEPDRNNVSFGPTRPPPPPLPRSTTSRTLDPNSFGPGPFRNTIERMMLDRNRTAHSEAPPPTIPPLPFETSDFTTPFADPPAQVTSSPARQNRGDVLADNEESPPFRRRPIHSNTSGHTNQTNPHAGMRLGNSSTSLAADSARNRRVSDLHNYLNRRARVEAILQHPAPSVATPSQGDVDGFNHAIEVLRRDGLNETRSQQLINRYHHERMSLLESRNRDAGGSPPDPNTRNQDADTRQPFIRNRAFSPMYRSRSDEELSRERLLAHMRGRRARFAQAPEPLFSYRSRARPLGDYIRDEDFDASYESLISLTSIIGDAKPRSTPDEVISGMLSAQYKDWATPDSDHRCPICLDDYEATDPVLKLNECSHWLHKDCLQQWLKGANTCPVCRNSVHNSQSRNTRRFHLPNHGAGAPGHQSWRREPPGGGGASGIRTFLGHHGARP